jgi:glucose-6-phosphate isomerase
MDLINFDGHASAPFISEAELIQMQPLVEEAAARLINKSGPGKEFLGWMDLPVTYDRDEFDRIKGAADRIKATSEVLVVIGIGGSFLGAKAGIEFCSHTFYNQLPSAVRGTPAIYFAGTNLSGAYHQDLLELIGDRDFAINVISKSGTTTEPAIAFRIFKQKLEEKYGKEGARSRIFATTDASKGALKTLADREGYETFVVPDHVGGRFSVLTAVGLLPIACAGLDIEALIMGSADARAHFLAAAYSENAVFQYVANRNILHRKGKDIELLTYYEPRCQYLAEWWKQLFGESEGKDGKGIFPASVSFTADLHSMGQYIQDGRRHIFETMLEIGRPKFDITLARATDDLDGLNYLAGRGMDEVNKKAALGTVMAHTDGGVPNLKIGIPEATPYHLGGVFYFFELACGISGYLLGVNPFDQPGVEAYKKNMFALLGKP